MFLWNGQESMKNFIDVFGSYKQTNQTAVSGIWIKCTTHARDRSQLQILNFDYGLFMVCCDNTFCLFEYQITNYIHSYRY
jgi:hypothetical protein